MKTLLYILLILCVVSCKHNNETMKSESVQMEVLSVDDIDFDILSSEAISSKKLEEYFDLIKLKQEHPEFAAEIALQLKNFTKDSLGLEYSKGFTISDIEQLGASKLVSDSIEQLVLGFRVSTNSETFKDSILIEISSKIIDLDGETRISKKIRFLNPSH